MHNLIDRDIPLVVIYNNLELFFGFLSRAEASALPRPPAIPYRQYSKGDRALLSLGDPKLVFVSAPIPHADDLCRRLDLRGTAWLAPGNPSPWLCLDILLEPPLIRRLVEYAGPSRTVQIVPYGATPQFWQLVEVLRAEHDLNVILPETPEPDCLWVRDYLDSKAGFRALASRWLPDADELLPNGVVCRDEEQAAQAVKWFMGRGQECLVKPDGGESGIGQQVFEPGGDSSIAAVLNHLRANPYLRGDRIVVEEYIRSPARVSPSLEVFVPPLGRGEPEITYLSNQLFLGLSDFYGLLISRELYEAKWYPPLAEAGLILARRMQEMGYVGHFDLDTIVDAHDRIYLLEINTRRTAGTHVHEFAHWRFGPDYLNRITLLSINKMKTGAITRYDDLAQALSDVLYPMPGNHARGVIPVVTSILAAGELGCLIVAPSTEEALRLHGLLHERLKLKQ